MSVVLMWRGGWLKMDPLYGETVPSRTIPRNRMSQANAETRKEQGMASRAFQEAWVLILRSSREAFVNAHRCHHKYDVDWVSVEDSESRKRALIAFRRGQLRLGWHLESMNRFRLRNTVGIPDRPAPRSADEWRYSQYYCGPNTVQQLPRRLTIRESYPFLVHGSRTFQFSVWSPSMDSTTGLVKPSSPWLTAIVCEGASWCFGVNVVISKG